MSTDFRHDWPPIPDPAQQASEFWAAVWATVRAELMKQPYANADAAAGKPDAEPADRGTSWIR